MDKKIHSVMMLTLLLVGMLTLAFGIQPIKAEPSSTADIIHPQEGQFANYHLRVYGAYPGEGWWNTSYIEYVQPHLINTTLTTEQPYESGTFWCTTDTTNRLVTNTSLDFYYWNQTWYIFWIETDVTTGSTINWFDTTATIVGSEILHVAGMYVDCWITNASFWGEIYGLSHYDKISGLLTLYQEFYGDELSADLTLNVTDIPIGREFPTTIEGLKAKTEELGSEGEIDNQGIVKSLLAKLNVAQKLVDRGKIEQAKTILEKAFIPQVQNLTDIHITQDAAEILIESAEYIISHL